MKCAVLDNSIGSPDYAEAVMCVLLVPKYDGIAESATRIKLVTIKISTTRLIFIDRTVTLCMIPPLRIDVLPYILRIINLSMINHTYSVIVLYVFFWGDTQGALQQRLYCYGIKAMLKCSKENTIEVKMKRTLTTVAVMICLCAIVSAEDTIALNLVGMTDATLELAINTDPKMIVFRSPKSIFAQPFYAFDRSYYFPDTLGRYSSLVDAISKKNIPNTISTAIASYKSKLIGGIVGGALQIISYATIAVTVLDIFGVDVLDVGGWYEWVYPITLSASGLVLAISIPLSTTAKHPTEVIQLYNNHVASSAP